MPYSRISEQLKRAVLVAEDNAFWEHDGIDFEQISRSRIEIQLGARAFTRGASTITQQLAKNLYLSPSRNSVRKLRELLITRRLEAELSKRRILELYLNVIEWGDGIFGAEAAARAYFRKSAATITAPRGGAAGRRDHQPARPEPAASVGAPRGAAAAHPQADARTSQPPPIIELAGTPEGRTGARRQRGDARHVASPEPPPEPLPEVKPIPHPDSVSAAQVAIQPPRDYIASAELDSVRRGLYHYLVPQSICWRTAMADDVCLRLAACVPCSITPSGFPRSCTTSSSESPGSASSISTRCSSSRGSAAPQRDGAYATCHCLTLPTSEPGYYYWRDRSSGEVTRRSDGSSRRRRASWSAAAV